jgi:hypothetical protein
MSAQNDRSAWKIVRAVLGRLWTCLMLAILFVAVVIIVLLLTKPGLR